MNQKRVLCIKSRRRCFVVGFVSSWLKYTLEQNFTSHSGLMRVIYLTFDCSLGDAIQGGGAPAKWANKLEGWIRMTSLVDTVEYVFPSLLSRAAVRKNALQIHI
mmetsp:Transcript_8748/g.14178  ORF Transcript_8748/g.14178 Transcript_8748/m.14178 type:complete len:104 (-) Transcript_8748:229-540(-)